MYCIIKDPTHMYIVYATWSRIDKQRGEKLLKMRLDI